MPPRSKAQARFLWAKKPKIANKWATEGEMSTKGLPEKVTPIGVAKERVRVRIP